MIRRTTACILILAIIAGGFLFKTSQNVQKTQNKIAKLEQKTINEEDNLRVLKTEWSYLNQPENLENLAAKHLKNSATKPIDLVSFDRLNLENKKVINVAMIVNNDAEIIAPDPLQALAIVEEIEILDENLEVAAVEIEQPEIKTPINVSLPIKKPYFRAKTVAYTPKKINNRVSPNQFKDFNSLLESLE